MPAGNPLREPDETSGDAEVLDAGSARAGWLMRLMNPPPRKRSRWRSGLWLALALAVGLAVGLATHPKSTRVVPQSAPHDAARISMATVRALADHDRPPVTYVRQTSPAGACATVAAGHSPRRAISAALRKAFPGYVFKDAALTLDQFTGLCSIQVRATYRGAVLVVSVASPAAQVVRATYVRLETGIETVGGVTTKYALALNETGWTVLVGATGQIASLPRADDLMRFVQDRSLTW